MRAESWLFSTFNHGNFLTLDFIKLLHTKMFGDTWQWAGQFRSTEKNIGVAPYNITTDLNNLLDDVRYQVINQSFQFDEIAYRFHHRLVAIHPFPNGNGRHARFLFIKIFIWLQIILNKCRNILWIFRVKKMISYDYRMTRDLFSPYC